MFNIQCLTSEPNQKWKKANMHSLDQFATHSPEKFCHIKWKEKTLFWRSRDHLRAILGVLISVWNLVKPSMFTTQCTSSFSSSCICAAQPATCCAHAMTSSCRPEEAAPRGNPGIFTPGVLPRSLLRGHFSCNQPTPTPRIFSSAR